MPLAVAGHTAVAVHTAAAAVAAAVQTAAVHTAPVVACHTAAVVAGHTSAAAAGRIAAAAAAAACSCAAMLSCPTCTVSCPGSPPAQYACHTAPANHWNLGKPKRFIELKHQQTIGILANQRDS